MGKPSIQVQEWMVFLSGIHIYIYESRFINYLFNLFKFIVCLGVLLIQDTKKLFLFLQFAVLVLFPYSCVRIADIIVFLGKTFCVDDSDIQAAFSSIGLKRLFYWLLSFNKYKSDADINTKLENLERKALEMKNLFEPTANALHSIKINRNNYTNNPASQINKNKKLSKKYYLDQNFRPSISTATKNAKRENSEIELGDFSENDTTKRQSLGNNFDVIPDNQFDDIPDSV
jgi:hypothetical protein